MKPLIFDFLEVGEEGTEPIGYRYSEQQDLTVDHAGQSLFHHLTLIDDAGRFRLKLFGDELLGTDVIVRLSTETRTFTETEEDDVDPDVSRTSAAYLESQTVTRVVREDDDADPDYRMYSYLETSTFTKSDQEQDPPESIYN